MNHVIESKKFHMKKQSIDGQGIPKNGMPLSMQSSDQTPMSFGVVRSMPITKHHSRHGSLAKTNTSTSLYGASLKFNQSLVTSKQESLAQPTIAKKVPKMVGNSWSNQ